MRPTRTIPFSADNLRAIIDAAPSTFLEDVTQARDEAVARYPHPRASLHEAYAYLKEEVDEVWELVKQRDPDPASLYIELTHVVACAWRMAVECGLIES